MKIYAVVGEPFDVRRVAHALDRRAVDAFLDEHGLEWRSDQVRLPDDGVMPGAGKTVGAEADARPMHERRAVVTTTDVVLASPHGLHGRAGRLRHVQRLGDEVGGRRGAPSEASAEERRVDLDLLG